MSIIEQLQECSIESLKVLYQADCTEKDFQVNQTKPEFEGDYTGGDVFAGENAETIARNWQPPRHTPDRKLPHYFFRLQHHQRLPQPEYC